MKKHTLYALITVCIWSTLAAVVKLQLTQVPNLQALAVSSYIAAAFLLLLNLMQGKGVRLRQLKGKDYAVMGGLGFLGLFLYSALYYYGLGTLSSQEACILNYLWPIMLVLFSCPVLKEKMSLWKGAALLCSFLGIVILSAGGLGGTLDVGGAAACIVAAACYGLFSVLNKQRSYDQGISMMVFWLVTALCSTALGLFTENWVPLGFGQWLGMLWMGVVVNAVAYLLWALALEGAENTAAVAEQGTGKVPFCGGIGALDLRIQRVDHRARIARAEHHGLVGHLDVHVHIHRLDLKVKITLLRGFGSGESLCAKAEAAVEPHGGSNAHLVVGQRLLADHFEEGRRFNVDKVGQRRLVFVLEDALNIG